MARAFAGSHRCKSLVNMSRAGMSPSISSDYSRGFREFIPWRNARNLARNLSPVI
jgi:hypothetical protein